LGANHTDYGRRFLLYMLEVVVRLSLAECTRYAKTTPKGTVPASSEPQMWARIIRGGGVESAKWRTLSPLRK
jgi:hypothetical protein